MIGSTHWYIDSSGSRVGSVRRLPTRPSEVEAELLLSNPLAHPTVMFAPGRLAGPVEYSSEFPDAEDFELWLRLRRQTKLANLREPLLERRAHAESVMAIGDDRGAASCLRALQIHTRTMTPSRIRRVFNASSSSVRLSEHAIGLVSVNLTNLRFGDVPRAALVARSLRAFAVHVARKLRRMAVFDVGSRVRKSLPDAGAERCVCLRPVAGPVVAAGTTGGCAAVSANGWLAWDPERASGDPPNESRCPGEVSRDEHRCGPHWVAGGPAVADDRQQVDARHDERRPPAEADQEPGQHTHDPDRRNQLAELAASAGVCAAPRPSTSRTRSTGGRAPTTSTGADIPPTASGRTRRCRPASRRRMLSS